MQKFFKLSLLIFISLLSICATANEKELKKLLSKQELKRIAAAEKLIAKGDNIIAEAKELEKEVKRLQNADGRIKTSKINKQSREATELKMKAAVFYRDGYNKYIKILDTKLKDLAKDGNFNAHNKRQEIEQIQKQARKLYNKANNLSEAENKIELIEQAEAKQNKAIKEQSEFIIMALNPSALSPMVKKKQITVLEESKFEKTEPVADNNSTAQDPENKQAETTSETTIPVTPPTKVKTETAVPVEGDVLTTVISKDLTAEKKDTEEIKKAEAPVVKTPVKEEIITTKEPDVFLTIQFMADRKKASQSQIQSVYKGSMKVIEMEVDGWFKYSIGKYQSIAKAKAEMVNEKVRGFIVAYNKNQRISIKEALTLLNQ